MKKEFTYYLYSPCGNDTALVETIDINERTKKVLNDKIMEIHPNIEQVGFFNNNKLELTMAGGEFCGNATRSAAFHYLNGKYGEIDIKVSNSLIVKAGVTKEGKAWSQIPLYEGKDFIREVDNGIYEIIMNGIKFIILEKEISEKYLLDLKNIKSNAIDIINKYNIKDNKAIGVIFIEEKDERIKIHPVVWVKSINTLFYETACGSGTTAVTILEAIKCNCNKKLEIIQPSNQIITAKVDLSKGKVEDAYIFGNIKVDKIKKKIKIDV